MTRSTFAGTANDVTLGLVGDSLTVRRGVTLTFWDSASGGTQLTDLLLGGSPVTTVTSTSRAQIPAFQGPDGVTQLWADDGSGARSLLAAPVASGGTPTTVTDNGNGTVTIGTALLYSKSGVDALEAATGNAQTGTTYTPGLGDGNALVTVTNTSPVTVTLPTNASVAFPVWTTLQFKQGGVGYVTVSPAAGVTLAGRTGTVTAGQELWLTKTGTNTWLGNVVGAPLLSSARAYLDANVTPANNATLTLADITDQIPAGGGLVVASGGGLQVTAPGMYTVEADGVYTGAADGVRNFQICVNGTIKRDFGNNRLNTTGGLRCNKTALLSLAANDVITMTIYWESATTVVGGSTTNTGLTVTYTGPVI